MSEALSVIAARQEKVTEDVLMACHRLLDYEARNSHAAIRNLASDMIMAVHLDASYLSERGQECCRSKFLSHKKNDEQFKNGSILTLYLIIKHVMESAYKVDLAVLF